jgi:hypothetical protein
MDIADRWAVEAVCEAQRILYREKWRICEHNAARALAGSSGLRWTRLFPESAIIRIVALDGVVIGRVRYDGRRWIAIGDRSRGPVADCGGFCEAVLALVCEATRRSPRPQPMWPLPEVGDDDARSA